MRCLICNTGHADAGRQIGHPWQISLNYDYAICSRCCQLGVEAQQYDSPPFKAKRGESRQPLYRS